MQGDRERCLEAGMNDYVTKPVDPKALAEALEKWLPRDAAAATKQATGKPEEAAVELLGTDLKSVPNNSGFA